MVKNKSRLAIKLFIIVWIVLAVHIALKLTFNYWQPYIIPNETLSAISDFIDANRWIEIILNAFFYTFNALLMILASIKRWWFKSKKQALIVILLIVLGFTIHIVFNENTIHTIFLAIILPLILDIKKWFYTILTFIFNNIFVLLSLWLCGFNNTNEMTYIIQIFFVFDYYIMVLLNYFVFNLIRKEK